MRQRSFELIRKPDLIGSSFPFNNVLMRYVATCPETGISFYINNGQGGVVGVRVYPDGRKVLENASGVKQGKTYAHGKEEYMKFKHAFGKQKGIFASHAVYIAWHNKEIPAGMTIDHINGVTTDNFIGNLRCVTIAVNQRDGGFLRKLRNNDIDPADVRRSYLLRYFDRMAHIKANISTRRYYHLDRADLMTILFYDTPVVYAHFKREYNIELPLISNF